MGSVRKDIGALHAGTLRALAVRSIFNQLHRRIDAQMFVAFKAFCIHAALRHKLRLKASGLTPRSLIKQLSAILTLDVDFPTTDGRALIFSRYTAPNKTQELLLAQLGLELPPQSAPRITCDVRPLLYGRDAVSLGDGGTIIGV